jgi:hypothetical protein
MEVALGHFGLAAQSVYLVRYMCCLAELHTFGCRLYFLLFPTLDCAPSNSCPILASWQDELSVCMSEGGEVILRIRQMELELAT